MNLIELEKSVLFIEGVMLDILFFIFL